MQGAHPREFTPVTSFADELVGGLAAKLGREVFLRRVRIVGIDAAVRPLLNRIVTTRLKQSRFAASDNPSADSAILGATRLA
jgi:hypothetical protein